MCNAEPQMMTREVWQDLSATQTAPAVITSSASRVGNGGTRSCSSSIWSKYSGLKMSTRVLSACGHQPGSYMASSLRVGQRMAAMQDDHVITGSRGQNDATQPEGDVSSGAPVQP